MPLLHVVGVAPTGQTFSLAFCFLKAEQEEDYLWAMDNLKTVFAEIGIERNIFVTDRELALISAIAESFPSAHHLLCIWHVNKNVLAKCKPKFQTAEEFEAFNKRWSVLVHSKSVEDFNVQWEALQTVPSPVRF